MSSDGEAGLAEWGPRGTAGVSFAAALTFDSVDVRLGGRPVLENFSLALTPGEIICLLGESGSGKSTILRVAAGIQPISGGEVRINDRIEGERRGEADAGGAARAPFGEFGRLAVKAHCSSS